MPSLEIFSKSSFAEPETLRSASKTLALPPSDLIELAKASNFSTDLAVRIR